MATETPAKSMSSRLLTMKFMQRAAASASPSSRPITPTTNEKSSKRRKTSHTSIPQQAVEPLLDQTTVKAALAEEDDKRREALLKHAAEVGDARWTLDIPDKVAHSRHAVHTPLHVVQVGFAQIDSPNIAADGTESTENSHDAVQPFRRYNMNKKKRQTRDDSESGTGESSSDSESSDSSQDLKARRQSYGQDSGSLSSPVRKSPRKTSHAKRGDERTKATQLAEQRRKKEVKLNYARPLAISGTGGGISSGGAFGRPPVTCHRCRQTGHVSKDCRAK